jgi:hypothetical protein
MTENNEFELEPETQVEELVEQNPAIQVPDIPGAVVEMQPAADAEVIRAADIVPDPEPEPDLSYIDEVFDATTEMAAEPKPKKVKIPVVPEVKDEKFPAPVKVEALVFKARMKNSQSVRLVQQALIEQGYTEAGSDIQGWLCEGTQAALARFQTEHGLVGGGTADEATVAALFEGSATHYWDR